MVNNHAFRFVPGWKLSCLSQALTSVSCTRSSALSAFWDSDTANARKLGIAPRRSALKAAETAMPSILFRDRISFFKLGEQRGKAIRHFVGHEIVVILLQLAADLGIRPKRIGRGRTATNRGLRGNVSFRHCKYFALLSPVHAERIMIARCATPVPMLPVALWGAKRGISGLVPLRFAFFGTFRSWPRCKTSDFRSIHCNASLEGDGPL